MTFHVSINYGSSVKEEEMLNILSKKGYEVFYNENPVNFGMGIRNVNGTKEEVESFDFIKQVIERSEHEVYSHVLNRRLDRLERLNKLGAPEAVVANELEKTRKVVEKFLVTSK